jgi:Cof subfamily protein (haloacid dehalogenase superfamily)
MQNIKLIAIDLDNTLLRRGKTISDYTVDVFRRVRERGVMVAFATSRSENASARYRARLNVVPDFAAYCGGVHIKCREQDIKQLFLPDESVKLILEHCCDDRVAWITAVSTRGYLSSKPIRSDWIGWEDYADGIHTDFQTEQNLGEIYKFTLQIRNEKDALDVATRLPNVALQHFNGEDWYQFSASNVSKATAVAHIANTAGVSVGEIVAFGDDHNDIAMLRECGVGVAMSNAIDECKAVADDICGDCDEDGVARWIEKHMLLR